MSNSRVDQTDPDRLRLGWLRCFCIDAWIRHVRSYPEQSCSKQSGRLFHRGSLEHESEKGSIRVRSTFAPETCHERLFSIRPELSYDDGNDLCSWVSQLRACLEEVMGLAPEPVDLNIRIQYDRSVLNQYREVRFIFSSEEGADVPCHLLLPKTTSSEPYPVMICLQGHSTGMHISLGRLKYDGDEEAILGGRDYAIQGVRRGYAVLTLEQRAFGERKDSREGAMNKGCHHATATALLLGRTMVGERVFDVSRSIDALEEMESTGALGTDRIDLSRIGCMGNSGGGTITYYASCLDTRITALMPSCSVCTYVESIGRIDHCTDNYMPGALRFFDIPDLAGLIAPRPLVLVSGREDPIFPIEAVEKAFETICRIYRRFDAESLCHLVVGDGGHRFYPDQAWPVFQEVTGWISQNS